MKKILLSLAVLLLLAGCSDSSIQAENKPETPPKQAQQKEVANVPEPKPDKYGNYDLTVVGQKVKDIGNSTVELVKIKQVNEKVKIAPMEVTIKSIKVFKWSHLPQAERDDIAYIASDNATIPDPFYYIQIIYDVENTEAKNVDFDGLDKVVLSDGSQLDAANYDFIVDDNNLDPAYYGKVKKEDVVGLIIKNPDINWVKLIFAEPSDHTTGEFLSPAQQVEYKF